jgi:hypothetical protein
VPDDDTDDETDDDTDDDTDEGVRASGASGEQAAARPTIEAVARTNEIDRRWRMPVRRHPATFRFPNVPEP